MVGKLNMKEKQHKTKQKTKQKNKNKNKKKTRKPHPLVRLKNKIITLLGS